MPRKLVTNLSALTRLQWRGVVLADDTVKMDGGCNDPYGDVTEYIYEDVDGGEFTDDCMFWEKGDCFTEDAGEVSHTDPGIPEFVAANDMDGYVQVRRVLEGQDPNAALEALKTELAAEAEGSTE